MQQQQAKNTGQKGIAKIPITKKIRIGIRYFEYVIILSFISVGISFSAFLVLFEIKWLIIFNNALKYGLSLFSYAK